jgi:hypothetical protein
MSTETRVTLKVVGDPESTGRQVGRVLRLPRRPAPAPQSRVRPLWQRHDLFLEPAYSGIEPYEDSDDGLEDEV